MTTEITIIQTNSLDIVPDILDVNDEYEEIVNDSMVATYSHELAMLRAWRLVQDDKFKEVLADNGQPMFARMEDFVSAIEGPRMKSTTIYSRFNVYNIMSYIGWDINQMFAFARSDNMPMIARTMNKLVQFSVNNGILSTVFTDDEDEYDTAIANFFESALNFDSKQLLGEYIQSQTGKPIIKILYDTTSENFVLDYELFGEDGSTIESGQYILQPDDTLSDELHDAVCKKFKTI